MSSLRHPNITQFLGICFLPDTQLPLLVMELLDTSLDELLEHVPNLPLSLKRRVLEDVASGLLYLHDREPVVIHRDLTAKNVLLTSSLLAKITDMGNSRIIDMRPGQMSRTLSKLPGTFVYMPPEALDDRHRYGPALDIFSFGHLALFTITQVYLIRGSVSVLSGNEGFFASGYRSGSWKQIPDTIDPASLTLALVFPAFLAPSLPGPSLA